MSLKVKKTARLSPLVNERGIGMAGHIKILLIPSNEFIFKALSF
jgi:hypothetical protein